MKPKSNRNATGRTQKLAASLMAGVLLLESPIKHLLRTSISISQ